MKDKSLLKRITTISPEKRELLERLLRKRGFHWPSAATGEASPAVPSGRSLEEQALALNAAARPWDWRDKAEKGDIQRAYDAYHDACNATVYGPHSFFMNLGYVPMHNKQYASVQLPAHVVNGHSVKLVLEVIGDCDLTDRDVLDVGCGRGGTIHLIRRYFKARSVVGLDLSPRAIAFCRKIHNHPNTTFIAGDAENLPFEDAGFDVVINIESSHSYPDPFAFYREVSRVLRAGGSFLYADILPRSDFGAAVEFLRSLGFVTERDQDITSNVLTSCADSADLQLQAFSRCNDDKWMALALGAPGSNVYEDMKNGVTDFRILKFQKTQPESE